MRFPAVLCLQGVATDDARTFDRWEWRDLPLTLYAQLENAYAHEEAPVAGSIVEIGTGAAVEAVNAAGIATEGMVAAIVDTDDDGAAGAELARMLQAERLNGISVDYTYAQSDLEVVCTEEDDDGWCLAAELHYSLASIAAATVVGIPAFSGARVGSVPLDAPAESEDEPAEDEEAVTASGSLVIPRGRRPLARVQPRAAQLPHGGHALVASAGVDLMEPPAEWFENPGLTEYTPITITDEGRVLGHVAPWNSCHIGYSDICVPPPRSATNYAHFRTGTRRVRGAKGTMSVRTGVLTVEANHAPTKGPRAGHEEAIDHYAHSACGWADTAAGEDPYGPWVAGATRPDVTDVQLVTLRALCASGDWRPIPPGRGREMVGVLMVNYPGFRDGTPLAASASRIIQHNENATIIVSPPAALVAAGHGEDCGCGGLDAELVATLRALEPQARQALRDRLRAGV